MAPAPDTPFADIDVVLAARLRPLQKLEGNKPCLQVADGSEVSIVQGSLPNHPHAWEGPWHFDIAIDASRESAEEAADSSIPDRMIQQALRSKTAGLIVYGNVGSGKSAAVVGDSQSGLGVAPCVIKGLHQEAATIRSAGGTAEVTMQMMEIQEDNIRDLLVPSSERGRRPVDVQVLPTGIQVKGAAYKRCEAVDECLTALREGYQRRLRSASEPPRANFLLKLIFARANVGEATSHLSELFFLEMAGPDGFAEGASRQQEMRYTNKALASIRFALQAHRPTPPQGTMRSSKMNLLLASLMKPEALLILLFTLTPVPQQIKATLSLLEFATELGIQNTNARDITKKQGAGEGQGAASGKRIVELEEEVKDLKDQLAAALAGGEAAAAVAEAVAVKELKAEVAELQELVQRLKSHLRREKDEDAIVAEAVADIFRMANATGSGHITITEMKAALKGTTYEPFMRWITNISQFARHDRNHSGYLNAKELRTALRHFRAVAPYAKWEKQEEKFAKALAKMQAAKAKAAAEVREAGAEASDGTARLQTDGDGTTTSPEQVQEHNHQVRMEVAQDEEDAIESARPPARALMGSLFFFGGDDDDDDGDSPDAGFPQARTLGSLFLDELFGDDSPEEDHRFSASDIFAFTPRARVGKLTDGMNQSVQTDALLDAGAEVVQSQQLSEAVTQTSPAKEPSWKLPSSSLASQSYPATSIATKPHHRSSGHVSQSLGDGAQQLLECLLVCQSNHDVLGSTLQRLRKAAREQQQQPAT